MPYTFLHLKEDDDLIDAGKLLAEKLPEIIAEELSVKGRAVHDGGLSPSEIMVLPFSVTGVVNGKDIEIIVFAHPFSAHLKNIEERKDAIIDRTKQLLEQNHEHLTFAVCLIMAPMAYGEAGVINPMP